MSGFANPQVFGTGDGFQAAAAPSLGFVQMAGAAFFATYAAGTNATSLAHNTTQGNTLIAVVKTSSGQNVTGVSDSKGNTWTQDQEGQFAGGATVTQFRAHLDTALTTSDTVSFTTGATGANGMVELVEFSGIPSVSPVDANTNANVAGQTLNIGPTGATTVPAEIATTAVCRAGTTGSTVWGVPAGWTEVPSGLNASGGDLADFAYKILSTTQTLSATWTQNLGAATAGTIVSYK